MRLTEIFEDIIGDYCQALEPTECIHPQCPRHSVVYNDGEIRQIVAFLDRRYRSMYHRNLRQRRERQSQLRLYRQLRRSVFRLHNHLYESHVAVPLLDSPEELQRQVNDDGYETEAE